MVFHSIGFVLLTRSVQKPRVVCLYRSVRTLRSGLHMFSNLQLADGERRISLRFNCQDLGVGWIKHDIYSLTGILYSRS